MVEPKNAFDRGEWSMFKRITNVCFEKEYYFLAEDGTVYSRLSHQELADKEAAYDEFCRHLLQGEGEIEFDYEAEVE